MTDEERRMLYETDEMVRELHQAFMKVPAGSKTALIHDLRAVSDAYQKGSWGIRFMLWLLPTLGVVGMYWENVIKFFKG